MKTTPIPGEMDRWFVTSDSRPDITHIVDMNYHGTPACGCEQYMVRGLPCKHIEAVKAALVANHQGAKVES